MATEVFTSLNQQFTDAGVVLNGGKIYIYAVTTTTPLSVYSDTGLSVAAANPIICDSAGRHDMRYVAAGSYKVVAKTSADVTVWTRDNVDGRIPIGSGALAIASGGTSATTAAAALSALGGATAAQLASLSTQVATLAGLTSSTDGTHIATGTTAQRAAAPIQGDIRRNTTNARWEGYNNAAAFEQFFTDTEIASVAEAQAGTNNTHVMTPSRTNSAIVALSPFSVSYTSAAQTITAAGALTLAHLLGATPKLVQFRLKNTSTELGYSVNDEVVAHYAGEANTSHGVSIVVDATNLNIRFASGAATFTLLNKTTGVVAGIDDTKWQIIFRAWA